MKQGQTHNEQCYIEIHTLPQPTERRDKHGHTSLMGSNCVASSKVCLRSFSVIMVTMLYYHGDTTTARQLPRQQSSSLATQQQKLHHNCNSIKLHIHIHITNSLVSSSVYPTVCPPPHKSCMSLHTLSTPHCTVLFPWQRVFMYPFSVVRGCNCSAYL